jgi:drug/metabolite transporter (DMT)-like permease|tara:strand:+ start:624 stop:1481 length:858 start_codon:yes stop_codon:yes gene_type:complete
VTIIFGLLSAFSYGYADFVGALAAKRIRAVAATTYSFSVGLVVALILSMFVGADYSPQTIQTGIYAGVCSAVAISCLYAALALGPISIVSPLTAVVSAVIPVVFDVIAGQELSSFAVTAVVLILVAVVLVGFVPGDKVRLPSMPAFLYSIGAGLGFSGIFVFLDATDSDSGLAALVVMRVVGLILLVGGLLILWLRTPKKEFIERLTDWKLAGLVFLAGVGDVLGNVTFLIATRSGALAIAAVLTALYPVGTILLARVFLKERIAVSQGAGIALALGACALLAVG